MLALFNGRDVHLTESERQVVIDHAYVCGWHADRLAFTLQIGRKHAQELLREAADKVFGRDLNFGVPPRPKKKKRKPQAPSTSEPASAEPAREEPAFRPVKQTSARVPFGKAV